MEDIRISAVSPKSESSDPQSPLLIHTPASPAVQFHLGSVELRQPTPSSMDQNDRSDSESPGLSLTASAAGLHFLNSESPEPTLRLERQPTNANIDFHFLYPSMLAAGQLKATEEEVRTIMISSMPKLILAGGYSKRGECATIDDAKYLGLEPEDAEQIYVCDRDRHFAMFYFRDNFLQNQLADLDQKARVLSVRGWILNIITNQVVCKSFSEGSVVFNTSEGIRKINWKGYEFTPYIEGTTIRAFWEGSEWQYSVHRKIDCRGSRIPGVELEIFKMFHESWPDFDEKLLNKDRVYVFQVVHRDNQIMNPDPIDAPRVYHLATLSAFNQEQPLSILHCGNGFVHQENRLSGAYYLPVLSLDNVCDNYIDQGRSVVARCGFEITQLTGPQTRKLMEIRGVDKAPYVPLDLMYLRLSVADRPVLTKAVPHHHKDLVLESVMEPKIELSMKKLADFCARILQRKLNGEKFTTTKTLDWLFRQVVLEVLNLTTEKIASLYELVIRQMKDQNGETLYRCFRDMESEIRKAQRLADQKLVEGGVPPVSVEKKTPDKKSKKGPTIKGNVVYKDVYADEVEGPKKKGKKGQKHSTGGKIKPINTPPRAPEKPKGTSMAELAKLFK